MFDDQQDERLTPDDLDQLIYLINLCQTRMHPVYAPFVAMTCRGLRRMAERWRRS